MPVTDYVNPADFPRTLFPGKGDENITRMQLAAATGGCGQVNLVATEKYRDPTANPLAAKVPTLYVYSSSAMVLANCVFQVGKEVRNAAGSVVTSLSLAANIMHPIALTSFDVTTGPVSVLLGAPWQPLAP